MGLSDNDMVNQWTWTNFDGSKRVLVKDDFSNWKPRMRLQSAYKNCALINEQGIWRIEKCMSRNKFVCKK